MGDFIYFNIPLGLSTSSEVYGEVVTQPTVDYTLTEFNDSGYNSTIVSQDTLQSAFLYNSLNNLVIILLSYSFFNLKYKLS
jgi:prolipoprotein diacylglyceryltransferase